MPKILVLFHSRTGRTAALADAIAEGAKSVRFAEVDVRRVEDLAREGASGEEPGEEEIRERLRRKYRALGDAAALADYDGIIVGSPARRGVMAAELVHVIDRAAPLLGAGALASTVGSAFAPAQAPHGGQATTRWSIMTALATLGMLLVPPSDAAPAALPAESGGPTEGELAAARAQGQRVATVVEWVTHARSHGHGHSHGHSHSHGH